MHIFELGIKVELCVGHRSELGVCRIQTSFTVSKKGKKGNQCLNNVFVFCTNQNGENVLFVLVGVC